MKSAESSQGIYQISGLLLFLLITILVYLPGLNGGFLHDDFINIVSNTLIHPDNLSLLSLQQASGSFTPGGRHLSMLSFAINSYFLGPDPYGFKAVNLFIHLINGILIFLLTRSLLTASRLQTTDTYVFNWLPVLVTAAWLLNPMELSTVLYSVQRMTGLSTFFILGGLLMFTSGRLKQLSGETGIYHIIFGLIAGTLLAYWSKENGILLLPFALLIEVAFFRFKDSSGSIDRSIVVVMILLPALAFITLVLAVGYSPERVIAGYSQRDFTLDQRLMTEARILWLYLRLIIAPSNSMLGIWHDDIAVSTSILSPTTTLPAIGGVILLLAAGVYLIKRIPLIGLGILWFFVAHSLESTIIPLELMHEHRNYLASYGVLLSLFASILLVFGRISRPGLGVVTAMTIVALYTLLTVERSHIWSNPLQHALLEAENHPASARAQYEAGRSLVSIAANGSPELLDAGMKHFETAAKLDRTSFIADLSLVTTAAQYGLPLQHEWFNTVKEKIRRYPINGSDISSLRHLLECQLSGTCILPRQEVLGIFRLAAKQGHLQAITLLAFYEANVMGNTDAAGRSFKKAVEKAPREASYRVNFASYLAAVGKDKEAVRQLDIAGQLDTFQIYQSVIDKTRERIAKSTSRDQDSDATDM